MISNCHPARDLKAEEWAAIRALFHDTDMVATIDALREKNNEPQPAEEILPKTINGAQEYANNHLRAAKMPYRLTRIGTWRRGDRSRRPLAVVRWPVGSQLSMKGLGTRRYRRYRL